MVAMATTDHYMLPEPGAGACRLRNRHSGTNTIVGDSLQKHNLPGRHPEMSFIHFKPSQEEHHSPKKSYSLLKS